MCGVGDGPKVQATQQPALKRSSASGRPSYQRRLLQKVLLSLIWGITTGCLSYAPKGKLPAGVCLIIIGTEGFCDAPGALLRRLHLELEPSNNGSNRTSGIVGINS